ncbi:hypothetical protein [Pseudomonas sp. OTU750018]|uniref:hypothetical protein n=1 Tax=Pseudomonas sp. OTU750018 TaxID=2709708 RepID=UPI0014236AD8|nr:hypothetical protein [Pseudomonas sp. OTU750018]
MFINKIQPVDSLQNLKDRVDRFFKENLRRSNFRRQLPLDLKYPKNTSSPLRPEHKTPADLLNFISSLSPENNIFLFGGVLRDLAIFGKRGFNSDIDIVVEGDWARCSDYIQTLGARKNKFGGFRLEVSGWPIDIWNAKETWAISQGLIQYNSIASLTKTTILNWDAILMNWKTRSIICPENYLDDLQERQMDMVLLENPNPLGATVRVFRHLCSKDAKSITKTTAEYLAISAQNYSLNQLRSQEFKSYGNTLIEPAVYELFEKLKEFEEIEIRERFRKAANSLEKNGSTLSYQQLSWEFKEE